MLKNGGKKAKKRSKLSENYNNSLDFLYPAWYNSIVIKREQPRRMKGKIKMERMTVAEVLKNEGINFEECGIGHFKGTTKSGKYFYMYSTHSVWGNRYTLGIEGRNTKTGCLITDAIKAIKKY